MRLAVFLEPNDSLKKEIIFWKKTINEKYTDSPYNTHPPHSTVINLDVINHINAVNGNDFTFFSDIDNDDDMEKIRYFLDNLDLKKESSSK